MDTVLYIEINLIGIILLFIMLFSINSAYFDVDKIGKLLFKNMLMVNMFVFVFDIGMSLLDGKMFAGARTLLIVFTVLYLIFNPVACLVWALYGDYKLHGDIKALKNRMWLYLIPVFISSIVIVCSIFTGWVFNIDENNIYNRGSLSLVVPIISAIYPILITIMAFVKLSGGDKSLNKEVYLNIFVFPALPAIGTVLQMMVYGLPLIWICMTLSIFIIFVNIQNKQLLIDKLTGVYNRYYLEYRLDYTMKNLDEGSDLYVLMVDIDRFKNINDSHGHLEGDLAIKAVASCLCQACKKQGDVARYGGDEFLIMYKCKKDNDISTLIDSIKSAVADMNLKNYLPFQIEISVGYCKFDVESIEDISSFVEKADEQMYINKKNREAQRAYWRE